MTVPVRAFEARPLSAAPLSVQTALEAVACGFPSPAQDYWDGDIDLGEHLIRDRVSTFIMRTYGDSMEPSVRDGDEIIVDRSLRPRPGHMVVAVIDGELTVKRFGDYDTEGRVVLVADNPGHPPVVVPELSDATLWGVVTWVLHREA